MVVTKVDLERGIGGLRRTDQHDPPVLFECFAQLRADDGLCLRQQRLVGSWFDVETRKRQPARCAELIMTAARKGGQQEGDGKKDRDPETHAGASGRERDDWRKSDFADLKKRGRGFNPRRLQLQSLPRAQ